MYIATQVRIWYFQINTYNCHWCISFRIFTGKSCSNTAYNHLSMSKMKKLTEGEEEEGGGGGGKKFCSQL